MWSIHVVYILLIIPDFHHQLIKSVLKINPIMVQRVNAYVRACMFLQHRPHLYVFW